MSNILLFFMSSYTPTVENGAYNRAQTNEAVLYELQKKKESRTDMVLALCSDKVRKDPCVPTLDGGAPTTTLTYFRQHVLPAANIRDDHFFPNDRGTLVRAHRCNGLDHIRDHIRIGNDDLFRLVTAQIGELFQHFFCGM